MESEAINKLVQEWNELYEALNKEVRLKDLSPEDYEAEVASALFGIAKSWDIALQVLAHDDNQGGWMYGDVEQFIKNKGK